MADLRETIEAVRADGRTRDCRCPAHEDGRASLSVSRGDRQPIVLQCHATCSPDAVLAAAGMTWADICAEREAPQPRPQIVATYQYRDEGGRHLYDVLRYEPKTFRQRAADGSWSTKGIRRVLYRLPELQGKTTAFVVEGERDADRLHSIGLCGTTAPSGAGRWLDSHSQQLKAASVERVVILPDNDSPEAAGERY